MRIGIDLQVLAQRPWTGVGKYAWNLAQALAKLKTQHEFVFFQPKKKSIPFYSTHIRRARIMQRARLDVLHGPANVLPLFYSTMTSLRRSSGALSPRQGRATERMTRSVITLHDLAIYRHPEWFAKGQWFSTKILVPRSIKKADAIIVPSEATKRDLMDLFRVREEKIHVVAHGVEPRFFKEAGNTKHEALNSKQIPNPILDFGFYKKYILFVGTLEPRKNVGRLIEAYQGLPEEIKREYELVIAGTPTSSPPISRSETGGEREGVKYLGYVPDDDLPALYQNASVFVYPSLYEGFGLPVLEALAAGIPVITSKNSPMAELGSPPREGESEGVILVDPTSVPSIRQAMVKVLTDPQLAREMGQRGVGVARGYTWEKAALKTLRVYENVKFQSSNVKSNPND